MNIREIKKFIRGLPYYPEAKIMKVEPLAYESLGVRSSSIHVETEDIQIVIDPAVALAPSRFGLPPHPIEYESKQKNWSKILNAVKKSTVLVISHYHYDHFEPKEPDIYSEKIVLLKHPHVLSRHSSQYHNHHNK